MNKVLLIIGVVLGILGLIGYLQFSAQYNSPSSLCNSVVKDLLKNVTNECSTIQTYMFMSIGVLILGVVLSIIGFTSNKNH